MFSQRIFERMTRYIFFLYLYWTWLFHWTFQIFLHFSMFQSRSSLRFFFWGEIWAELKNDFRHYDSTRTHACFASSRARQLTYRGYSANSTKTSIYLTRVSIYIYRSFTWIAATRVSMLKNSRGNETPVCTGWILVEKIFFFHLFFLICFAYTWRWLNTYECVCSI